MRVHLLPTHVQHPRAAGYVCALFLDMSVDMPVDMSVTAPDKYALLLHSQCQIQCQIVQMPETLLSPRQPCPHKATRAAQDNRSIIEHHALIR